MNNFGDIPEWKKLKSTSKSWDDVLDDVKMQHLQYPSYIFLVGINEKECPIKDSDIEIINEVSGEAVLEMMRSIRGTVIGIIVGNDIVDMTIKAFVAAAEKVLAKKIIVIKDSQKTEMLLREMISE